MNQNDHRNACAVADVRHVSDPDLYSRRGAPEAAAFTPGLSEVELAGVTFLTLIQFFKYGSHLTEGAIDTMGLPLGRTTLIRLGWLRRVKGPGRYDNDWLIPAGPLLERVIAARGTVETVWLNYVERLEEEAA